MRSGAMTRFTAPGSVTNGQFGLLEWNLDLTGGGPAPHLAQICESGRTLSPDEWTALFAAHDRYPAE